MNKKRYTLRPGKNIRALAHGIEDYLIHEENMRCIVMRTESGAYIVQGQDKHEEIIRWAGLGRGISIRLDSDEQDRVNVQYSCEKQTQKWLAQAAGILLLWGLAFTSAYGLIRQELLTWRVERLVRLNLC